MNLKASSHSSLTPYNNIVRLFCKYFKCITQYSNRDFKSKYVRVDNLFWYNYANYLV